MNTLRTVFIIAILALLWSTSAPALADTRAELLDLRVGRHKSFDRVVFEFPAELPREISILGDHRVQVRFPQGRLRADFAVPRLPENLAVVSGIQASQLPGKELVVDVFLKRSASPSELSLAGNTWRLAMDLAPRMSEHPVSKPEPEYIPGDRPIPTTFVEAPQLQETPKSETPKLAEAAPIEDTLNAAQIHSVLAYFFLSRGDTESALAEARRYSEITGTTLAAFQDESVTPTGTLAAESTDPSLAKLRMFFLSWPHAMIVMFGIGLVVGLLLVRVLPKSPIRLRLPKLALPARKEKIAPAEPSEELEADLHALETAVAEEPPRRAKKDAPAKDKPEEEPVPQEMVDAEKEAKETLMDRRVRRVLELNKEGRTVAAIAEELEMNQDEVKLILDLNRS